MGGWIERDRKEIESLFREILLYLTHCNNPIHDHEFTLRDIRVTRISRGERVDKEEPGILRSYFKPEDPNAHAAMVTYSVDLTQGPPIHVRDYFTQHLGPLLKDYNVNGDHMEIFKHILGEDQRSGSAKLFGSKRVHREHEMAAAEELLPRPVGISQTLLEAVDLLEEEINAASEEELQAQ